MDCSEEKKSECYKEAYDKLRLHFVYNAMNAMKYYIRNDPEKACFMINDLAVFMRGNVENALGRQRISLQEELKFAYAYAELESFRNPKCRLEWRIAAKTGEVLGGSIYESIEGMIKRYIFGASGVRTLRVTDIADGTAVCVEVVEEGSREILPIHKAPVRGEI